MATQSALIPLGDLKQSDYAKWEELAKAAVEPNPFFEQHFVLPSAAALKEDVALLVAISADGEWSGCLPVHYASRWQRLPIRVLAAWRHLYCFLGTPLIRTGAEVESLEAWLGPAGPQRRMLFGFDKLGADGPVAKALHSVAELAGTPAVRFERYTRATLNRDRESGHLGIKTKHRRELDRQRRRLAEQLGEDIEIRDRSNDPTATDDFLRIEASGWKGRAGTAFASIPGHADLFKEMCAAFAAQGRLQLISLETENRIAAMKCNISAGAGLFCFKIGFDEGFSAFSPGIQLERATIESLQEAPPSLSWIDTCADPNNRMSKRMWPDRRTIEAVGIPAPGMKGAVSRAIVRAGAKANLLREGRDDPSS